MIVPTVQGNNVQYVVLSVVRQLIRDYRRWKPDALGTFLRCPVLWYVHNTYK
jgi:hypothetical protein